MSERTTIGTIGVMAGVMAVPTQFSQSYARLVQHAYENVCGPDERIELIEAIASYHEAARNQMVREMKGDWLLMLDVDHEFEPDLLMRLIHQADHFSADVTAGFYYKRRPPYTPVLFCLEADGRTLTQIDSWEPKDAVLFQTGLVAGAGCLFVRRVVFERIRDAICEAPFTIRPPLTEDTSFFARCNSLGIPILINPKTVYPHLHSRPVTEADFESCRNHQEA